MSEEQQTWDGQPIATDEPRGVAVVVRRPAPDGTHEALVLHRAHEGPDYEGDWAWTSPAGARHPGEPVYPCALRELAEEAGLRDFDLAPLDLSDPWARFILDVGRDVEVELVDPEHDRFEWVAFDDAIRRVHPATVTSSFERARGARYGAVAFKPVADDDLADVVAWQHSPSAAEWFAGSPATVDEARERYAGRLAGSSATRMWVVLIDGVRAGYIQDYRVSAYDEYAEKTGDPEAVAFDYLIGEPAFGGGGWGRVVVWAFLRDVLCRDYPDAPRFLASPSHRNHRSIRMLETCGLRQGRWIDVAPRPGEPDETEVVCTLDRRHWFG